MGEPAAPRCSESPAMLLEELVQVLQSCAPAEQQPICRRIIDQLPGAAPSDLLLVADCLVSLLRANLTDGCSHVASLLLDEVCSSWGCVRLLPDDTLRAFLRVLLQGMTKDACPDRGAAVRKRRSLSAPDVMQRPVKPPLPRPKQRSKSICNGKHPSAGCFLFDNGFAAR